jgi:hypothetical protein
MRRMLDTLRLQWFKWVIEYDLGRQLGLFRDMGNLLGLGSDNDGERRASAKKLSAWLSANRRALLVGGGAALALLAALLLWRRRRGATAGPDARRGPDHPVVAEYTRAARALAGRGFPRRVASTPREHARELAARSAPGAGAYASLTELYYQARYAGAEVDLARARALGAEVRSELKQAR